MGTLKPGATYIYESPDGGESIYAREAGSSERVLVGQSFKARSKLDQIKEDKLWGDIRRMAEKHPELKSELDRVIAYYYLIKDREEVQWHPV
jgi:hypothetical protein